MPAKEPPGAVATPRATADNCRNNPSSKLFTPDKFILRANGAYSWWRAKPFRASLKLSASSHTFTVWTRGWSTMRSSSLLRIWSKTFLTIRSPENLAWETVFVIIMSSASCPASKLIPRWINRNVNVKLTLTIPKTVIIHPGVCQLCGYYVSPCSAWITICLCTFSRQALSLTTSLGRQRLQKERYCPTPQSSPRLFISAAKAYLVPRLGPVNAKNSLRLLSLLSNTCSVSPWASKYQWAALVSNAFCFPSEVCRIRSVIRQLSSKSRSLPTSMAWMICEQSLLGSGTPSEYISLFQTRQVGCHSSKFHAIPHHLEG